jgi:hypothetical protein
MDQAGLPLRNPSIRLTEFTGVVRFRVDAAVGDRAGGRYFGDEDSRSAVGTAGDAPAAILGPSAARLAAVEGRARDLVRVAAVDLDRHREAAAVGRERDAGRPCRHPRAAATPKRRSRRATPWLSAQNWLRGLATTFAEHSWRGLGRAEERTTCDKSHLSWSESIRLE